jgi:glucosamine-6-phosphate deaminase
VRIVEAADYNNMSQIAADYIIQQVTMSPNIKLGLATGGTPLGIYDNLIADHQKNGTSYQGITTFNLDEYIGLSGDNPNSYRFYMNHHLFNHIDIDKNKTFVPRGNMGDIQKECMEYENLIAKHGGIDLQILGIGNNGHIGFNEPGTPFDSETHVVELTPLTRQANARFFGSMNEVPVKAITMGIATIMKSREILLVVSGESKRDALKRLVTGESNNINFPASVLKSHPRVTIVADEAAIADLKVQI